MAPGDVVDSYAQQIEELALHEVNFSKKRAIVPYRCKKTGSMVWPLAVVYVGRRYKRDENNSSTLIIERIKMSEPEYMLFTLTKKQD